MGKSIKVLIIDGDKEEAELVLARLSVPNVNYQIHIAENQEAFRLAVGEVCPDVILAGFSLSAFQKHNALNLAKELCPDVPFLFLAGVAAEEVTQMAHIQTILHSDLEHFAYAASHDLQEPLRTISLFSKLLSARYKGALDAQADDYLKFVESAAQHMGALLESLSIYTQLPLEAENFERVDLNGIFHETLVRFQTAIEQSNAAVTSGHLPAVMGTGAHLGMVFQHLVDNALKYHGSDPPLVHVDAAQEDNHWVLSVKDNGIGFPQHYAEQVFGLFKRLNKRDYTGSGLGLSICKRIIDVHGGRIWANSQEDLGSTFYFTIPVRDQWQKSLSVAV